MTLTCLSGSVWCSHGVFAQVNNTAEGANEGGGTQKASSILPTSSDLGAMTDAPDAAPNPQLGLSYMPPVIITCLHRDLISTRHLCLCPSSLLMM